MNTIITSLITSLNQAPDAVAGNRQERIDAFDAMLWRSENWDQATKIAAVKSAQEQGIITEAEAAFLLGE